MGRSFAVKTTSREPDKGSGFETKTQFHTNSTKYLYLECAVPPFDIISPDIIFQTRLLDNDEAHNTDSDVVGRISPRSFDRPAVSEL